MTHECLLTHFDKIADAPDAISHLRRFILNLAVKGKLVDQNQNDESAAELLNRIQSERTLLVSEELTSTESNLVLFDPPAQWIWIRLGNLIISADSGWSPRSEGFPRSGNNWGVIKVSAVSWDRFLPDENKQLLPGISPPKEAQIHKGDFLISRANTSELVAKCVVVEEQPHNLILSDKIVRLKLTEFCNKRFVSLVNNHARHARDHYASHASGTSLSMKNVSRSVIYDLPIPFPPLAEQHRIVAKVDELMALCDRLEAAQAERESRRDRLAAASLQRLNQPADATAFREHARFHLSHLQRLTTRPEQIKQLRQTVLNLAVHGQLVAQDSTDEPVADSLTVSDHNRQATARTDRRADSEQQSLLGQEDCWEVPPSWEWRALADIVLFIDYRGKTPVKGDHGVRLITAKNVKKGVINLSPEEFVSEADYHKWMTRGFPKVGDILFTTEAPMGNAAVVRLSERFALAQRIINFRPYGAIVPDYLALYLLAEPFQFILDKAATGLTAKGIKASKLKRLPVVVPPLAEQHRIVAKVDELMALCDRLEAQLTTTQTQSRRLLEAVLHEALAGA